MKVKLNGKKITVTKSKVNDITTTNNITSEIEKRIKEMNLEDLVKQFDDMINQHKQVFSLVFETTNMKLINGINREVIIQEKNRN